MTQSEYWIGDFRSWIPAALLSGKVKIHFPYPLKDLPRGQTVEALFTIRYEGMYKNGQQHDYPVVIKRGLDGKFERIQLSIAGKTIDYHLMKEEEETITGKYVIKFPPDEGSFELKRNGPDDPVSLCSVM